MEILTIEKDFLIKLFNCDYIIEDIHGNYILDIKYLENLKNKNIFCKKIDRFKKYIKLY